MQQQYFIGRRAVGNVVDTGRKTPMGGIMLKVLFEDGSSEYMPEKRFNITKTTEPVDASHVRGMLVTYASKEIGSAAYSMLLEYGCRLSEVEVVLNQAVALTNAGSAKVDNILWGVDYADEKTLNQINDILIENVTKQANNNGSTPNGEGAASTNTQKV